VVLIAVSGANQVVTIADGILEVRQRRLTVDRTTRIPLVDVTSMEATGFTAGSQRDYWEYQLALMGFGSGPIVIEHSKGRIRVGTRLSADEAREIANRLSEFARKTQSP
jgi:hypothetical protein